MSNQQDNRDHDLSFCLIQEEDRFRMTPEELRLIREKPENIPQIVCGGSWDSSISSCQSIGSYQSADHYKFCSGFLGDDLGFRLIKEEN